MLLSAEMASGSGDVIDDTSSFTLYFESASMVGERRCVLFETVKDTIVESDEVFSFEASTGNSLDMFAEDNRFSLTVVDDDGMYVALVCSMAFLFLSSEKSHTVKPLYEHISS